MLPRSNLPGNVNLLSLRFQNILILILILIIMIVIVIRIMIIMIIIMITIISFVYPWQY